MTHGGRPRLLQLALIVASLLAAGCQADATTLAGRTFLSIAATEHGVPRPLVAGTRVRIDFQADTLSASGGCNSIGGPYRIEDGRLVTDDLFTTLMGCEGELMAQDAWLMALLGARPAITIRGDDVTLDSGTVALQLRDRRVVVPDLGLVGPVWVVESLIDSDAISTVPFGLTATLVFHADGTVDVDDGCNTGSGRWTAVAPGLEIADLGMTERACTGPAADLEAAILETIRAGTLTATIDGDRLVLGAGSRGLQFRAR